MSSPLRALLITVAVAASLAACNRDKETKAPGAPAPQPGAVVTPADAAAPMSFTRDTPYAKVSLTLPEGIKGQTDFHARLYAEEVRKLQQFVEGAASERLETEAEGSTWSYEKKITVTAALETGKLLSLKREDFDFSGGAHPNTLTTGLLWDKAMKRQIGLADLFRPGSDLTVLDRALCSAINTAKRARVPGSAVLTFNSKDWSCPRAIDTGFVLTPGDTPGKAAGLTFLIGPYQVGPYVEGGYELALPNTVFRSMIAVGYVDDFGGALVKTGDVTPR